MAVEKKKAKVSPQKAAPSTNKPLRPRKNKGGGDPAKKPATVDEPRGPGRPPGTPGASKYKPEYCKQIIEFMAKGGSVEAFAGKVGVAKTTPYDWAEAHKEFAAAKEIAEAKSLLWWENLGKKMAQGIGVLTLLKEIEKPLVNYRGEPVLDPKGKPIMRIERTYGAPKGSSGVWYANMKNRHGWRDRQEVDQNVDGKIAVEIYDYTSDEDDYTSDEDE